MRRPSLPLLVFLAVAVCAAASAAEVVRHGGFEMPLQEDNVLLPAALRYRWPDGRTTEIFAENMGLNLTFTSFEERNKFYREENRLVWARQTDPRFVTDAEFTARREVEADGLRGLQVDYRSSFADVRRTILLHGSEPRLSIEYVLTANRDVVVHETPMLGVNLRFADHFSVRSVCDARAEAGGLLTGEGARHPSHTVSLLRSGPVLLTSPDEGVSLLIETSHGGDVPEPPPVRLLQIEKGQRLVLTAHLHLGATDAPALRDRMAAACRALPAEARPFALIATAQVLRMQEEFDEAEAALLESARLNTEFAQPYSMLAALRRDAGRGGQPEAWVEAGYRMPYNYGYMLSGGGFHRTPGLTEAERRLHIFNVLIAVENTVFYADYYAWAARPFEAMGMYAAAAGIYRQALWATEYMPRSEAVRERTRAGFERKIAELEAKMLGQTATDLPDLIPVRVAPDVAN